jgi:hypothetical protein
MEWSSQEMKRFKANPERKERIKQFEREYNIKFVDGWPIQSREPFVEIRQRLGNFQLLCVIKFADSTIYVDRLYDKYQILLTTPIFNPNPDRIRILPPKLEIIDAENLEPEDWLQDIVEFILENKDKSKIITLKLECWHCSGGYEFYEMADRIIDALYRTRCSPM